MKYCKNCNETYRQKKYLICPLCGERLSDIKKSRRDFIFCQIDLIYGEITSRINNYNYLSNNYSDDVILKKIENLLKDYRDEKRNISIRTCFSDNFVNYLEIYIPVIIKTIQGSPKSNTVVIENVSTDFILKLIEWNKKQNNSVLDLHNLKRDYEKAKSLIKLYESVPSEEKLKLELEDD